MYISEIAIRKSSIARLKLILTLLQARSVLWSEGRHRMRCFVEPLRMCDTTIPPAHGQFLGSTISGIFLTPPKSQAPAVVRNRAVGSWQAMRWRYSQRDFGREEPLTWQTTIFQQKVSDR